MPKMRKKAKRPLDPLRHLHHHKAQPLRGWQKSRFLKIFNNKKFVKISSQNSSITNAVEPCFGLPCGCLKVDRVEIIDCQTCQIHVPLEGRQEIYDMFHVFSHHSSAVDRVSQEVSDDPEAELDIDGL